MRFTAKQLQKGMGWWPPFLGAGIRVRSMSEDFRDAVVEMKLGRLNRNYFGTHFGGSLYAMTDPFFAIMLFRNLGSDYLIWDKSGSIEYVAPGRGTVTARFHLSEKRIEEIRKLGLPDVTGAVAVNLVVALDVPFDRGDRQEIVEIGERERCHQRHLVCWLWAATRAASPALFCSTTSMAISGATSWTTPTISGRRLSAPSEARPSSILRRETAAALADAT